MSRRRGAAALGADPEEEEEEEAVATSEEEQEEDVSEDDEGEDEEAGPSGRVSGASDALVDVNDTEDEEDEDDEEDEEMFDEKHTVDDVLRSVNDERADGPAPYEILAQRKREANEKNKEAFRAELRSRGVEERDVEGLVAATVANGRTIVVAATTGMEVGGFLKIGPLATATEYALITDVDATNNIVTVVILASSLRGRIASVQLFRSGSDMSRVTEWRARRVAPPPPTGAPPIVGRLARAQARSRA